MAGKAPWWNEEVKIAVAEKKLAWKLYQKTKKDEDKQKYIQKRNNSKDTVKQAKQKTWEKFGENIETNSRNNKKDFWRTIKGLRHRERKRIRNIKNEKGDIVTDEKLGKHTMRINSNKMKKQTNKPQPNPTIKQKKTLQ